MKAWILQKANDMRLVESSPTKLAENNVKIKVEEVLLTKSEFETYTGENEKDFPFILGRNAVGVVSEVFDKATSMFQKMDRVVVEPYIPCENCSECLQGNYRNCTEMQELGYNCNGLLQNFADLPYTALHRLPDNLSNERALFVSYVSFCLNVVDALKLEKADTLPFSPPPKRDLFWRNWLLTTKRCLYSFPTRKSCLPQQEKWECFTVSTRKIPKWNTKCWLLPAAECARKSFSFRTATLR